MIVAVKLFAGARELAGCEQLEIELAAGANVGNLREALLTECPSLAPLLPHAVFAVDAKYASEDTPVEETNEIACIPPVSGG